MNTDAKNNCLQSGCNLKSDHGWFCREHRENLYAVEEHHNAYWYIISLIGVLGVAATLLIKDHLK